MALTRLILATATMLGVTSAGWADDGDYDDAVHQQTVQAGRRFQIGHARSWNPACKSTGGTYRITQPPAHGRLSQDRIESAIPEGRGECSGRPATVTRLFYTASPGYVGEDHLAYDEIYGNGGHRHVDENLTVLGRYIAFHEGEVLRSVPARGTLNVRAGTAVLIDDGSCPTGQIKQLIAGDAYKRILGSFSCIQR